MARMQPRETLDLRERFLDATRKGRLQDWNERIGEVAIKAGVKPEGINWGQSPDLVAFEVIKYMNMREDVETLIGAIADYEATHKD